MNDPSQIVGELIFGRWRSQILYAGVKLGVFDALGDASKTSSDIAEVLRLDPALTYRLLRALASLGLLHEDAHRVVAANLEQRRLKEIQQGHAEDPRNDKADSEVSG